MTCKEAARVRLTVLAVIDHYGPSSARRLRSYVQMRAGIDVSPPGLTDAVDGLRRADFVEAKAAGLLDLTPAGRDALNLFGALLEEHAA